MWECASNVTGITAKSEQRKIARVLNYHLGIEYTAEKREHGCTQTVLNKNCDKTGITKTGLKVTLISYKAVCRSCHSSQRHKYYVWHNFAKTPLEKQTTAQRGSVWFVKKDWKYINEHSTATSINWIREFSIQQYNNTVN